MSRSIEDLERDAFLGEAESLALLTQHPAWPVYENLLRKMRLSSLELLAKATADQVPTWQGVCATLLEIIDRPHQIVAAGRAIAEEEAQRRGETRQALDFVDGPVEDDL